MISNLPVSTASRYSMIDAKTTHAMGNMPKAAPFSVDIKAYLTGMPYTVSATTQAAASAVDAAIQVGLRLTPSM